MWKRGKKVNIWLHFIYISVNLGVHTKSSYKPFHNSLTFLVGNYKTDCSMFLDYLMMMLLMLMLVVGATLANTLPDEEKEGVILENKVLCFPENGALGYMCTFG